MAKRRAAYNPDQLGFSFEPIASCTEEGALGGLDRKVASAVGRILKDDPRTRYEIAGGMSAILEDDVSKMMLDAYASEARDGHNISFGRFLALIAETQRYDVLEHLVAEIGCRLIVGEEVYTAELGHITSQIEQLQARQRQLKRVAPMITRGGRRR